MESLDCLLDQFEAELEGIDAIYSDENVIASPANLTTIPKHTLVKQPKPQPIPVVVQKQ